MEKWSSKVAVVTGGYSGMGAAILAQLHKHGLLVVNLDISVSENTASEDGKVHNRKCDVASLDSIKENFAWIEQKFGVVHVLINCAGVASVLPMIDDSEESTCVIDKILDVNVRGLIHCTREALKLMKKSDDFCVIVNLCSVMGHGTPFTEQATSLYVGSKHAVRAFSESVRQELARSGNEKIRVTNLSPGIVNTRLLTDGFGITDEYLSHIKVLRPEDVADVVVMLLTMPMNVHVSELVVRAVGEKL